MKQPRGAVFLSYASEDAGAATRIAEALAAAGVDVWLDKSELRGGDAWDASIRAKIRDCALFIPIVSAHTEARGEGYFRLEWKLAVDRSHLMADDQPFLLPVVIDDTVEASARVPDAFRARQWVRLPGAGPDDAFISRLRRLLDGEPSGEQRGPPGDLAASRTDSSTRRRALAATVAATAFLIAIAYLVVGREGGVPDPMPLPAGRQAISVAVLPFANLSEDKANEYFSDGITEELLTVLQKIEGLRVAARASSFAFKGANATAQDIGRKLSVTHLVEGSVRRSGTSVRIAARLVRAATGEQIWSDAYTRDLVDVLAVQGDLAQAIVEQLHGHLGAAVTQSGKAQIRAQIGEANKGGTRNSEAHQLYLQGLYYSRAEAHASTVRAVTTLQRAVAFDPSFALAWAALSHAGWLLGANASNAREYEDGFALARSGAERAIQLQPDIAEGWLARAAVQVAFEFNWKGAIESLRRAQAIAPREVEVLQMGTRIALASGQTQRAAELGRQALALDPLNVGIRLLLGFALEGLGRYEEAQEQFQQVTEISPTSPYAHSAVALMLMRRQRLQESLAEVQKGPVEWERLTVQAQVLWALGRRAESDVFLKALHTKLADVAAYQIAQVYAHREDRDRAFEWLQRAARQRDPGIALCKADPTFVPLHPDPRWTAYLRQLNLTDEQLR